MHIRRLAHTRIAILIGLALFILLTPLASRAQIQDLFVANNRNSTISRFAGTGPGSFDTTATTLSDTSLNTPFGLTFDTLGDLFVSNTSVNTITEIEAGAAPGTFGAAIAFNAASLNLPESLTFDAHGDLFAANFTGNNSSEGTITEFASGGTPGTFGPGMVIETGLSGPDGLAFDALGDLFVANSNNSTITEFAAGMTPGSFGAVTTLTDPSVTDPRGLAFDAYGDLFAANQSGGDNFRGTITEFMAGMTPGTFGAVTTLTDPSLHFVNGLAVDALGDLFVSNSGGGTITEFPAGVVPGTFRPGMVVETGLIGPSGLAFGPSDPVPETSTTISLGLLLALGLGGIMVVRKKRKA